MNPERVGLHDADFMLALLEEGKALTTMEIISASAAQRGCGLTPHSRAADLRKRGHNIECKRVGRVNGRNLYEYRLLAQPPLSSALPGAEAARGVHPNAGRGGYENEVGTNSSGAGDLPSDGTAPEQISLPLPGSMFKKERAA